MKFGTPRRRNPFDNPLVALFTHVAGICISYAAGYFSLRDATWLPVIVGASISTPVDAVQLYFMLRRWETSSLSLPVAMRFRGDLAEIYYRVELVQRSSLVTRNFLGHLF